MLPGEGAMGNRRIWGLIGAALLVSTLAGDAAAYEHRRKTPSVGGQILYGTTAGDSDWERIFGQGMGVSFSLRQYIARDRAIGLTAEQQVFDHRTSVPLGEDDDKADKLEFQLLMVDYYFYFRRMYRQTPYLVISAGFYRPQLIEKFKDPSGDTGEHVNFTHNEGFLARAGIGLEHFISRNLSIDARGSGYFVNAPGVDGRLFTAQAAIGLHLYVGR